MLLQSVPNPDYMNGTSGGYNILDGQPIMENKCRCGAPMGSGCGCHQNMRGPTCSCGAPMGSGCGCHQPMGTTGSLGVSFAAPLTRGGFPGEIFTDIPMPTGNWKNAPTPVMLGTGSAPMNGIGTVLGAIPSIIGIGISCAVYYGAYKYYFSKDCKCNK